jgi:Phage tail tube protein, TTP
MASTFPNGTVFALSAALAAAKTVSAVTNANPGVATATAHGYADGNIVVMNAPGRLDLLPVRVDNSSTNAFDLEGIDTTSTTLYPSGFGVGSAQLAATFTSLSQTVEVTTSGGEQQFAQWAFLEDGKQRQRPTFKNARGLQLTMHYDPTLAWHAALLAADQLADVRVLRATLPTGAILYYSVYVGFDGQPAVTINENMTVVASFALASPDLTRYAS